MKKFLLGLLVVLLAVGAGTAGFLWYRQAEETKRAERFYEMRQSASFSQEEQDLPEVPVDFEELQKINPEVYGWLTIPGTAIDTPVLQREGDVAYYLSHTWIGEAGQQGAVCSESQYNGKGFQDIHTVLYGNNCSNGSLFGGLLAFEDENFFKEHSMIAVYTPDAIRYYRIFAAYEYDSRHLLQSFDLSNPRTLKRYTEEILQQRNLYAQIRKDTVIEEGDHLLTLSTTSSRSREDTFLVQALLERTFLR